MITRTDKLLLLWFSILGYISYHNHDYSTVKFCLWCLLSYSLLNALLLTINMILTAVNKRLKRIIDEEKQNNP